MVHIFFKKEYSQDYPPVFIQGWIFQDSNEFKTYLTTRVYAKLCDLEGKEDVKELLQEVPSTGFLDDNLEVILTVDPEFEPWKIGEALGACFLEDHFGVYFPWNTNRDARVPRASLPGPDLVGFVKTESGCRFAFGEVKTSWDKNVPPKVVYGRTGMTLQLEKLRDDSSIRNQLFRWLAFRARGSEWESQFKEAAGAYLNCNKDLCLYGVLVRDTPPALKDLEGRGKILASGCPPEMVIHLLGYYLVVPITKWPEIIRAAGMD
ncbi:MAG TPA: hypothetical protein HA302_04280 [Thermococcaceae archaeon]|nr:hypothetical protein [Thermococcaceae archaeon]